MRSGNMIPLDGTVLEGEAMVNQAALTGWTFYHTTPAATGMQIFCNALVASLPFLLCLLGLAVLLVLAEKIPKKAGWPLAAMIFSAADRGVAPAWCSG